MRRSISKTELLDDTDGYFHAVRNLCHWNFRARAAARESLKRLALDTKSLVLADACNRAVKDYSEENIAREYQVGAMR